MVIVNFVDLCLTSSSHTYFRADLLDSQRVAKMIFYFYFVYYEFSSNIKNTDNYFNYT